MTWCILTTYMAQWVGEGSEATCRGFECGIMLIFFTGNYTKMKFFSKKNFGPLPKTFPENSVIESNQSKGIGFESQHKLFINFFKPKNKRKNNFIQTSKSTPSYVFLNAHEWQRL